MPRILILGAGQSAPVLIRDLLQRSSTHAWEVTVADRDVPLAQSRIAGHPNAKACYVDAADTASLTELIRPARVVVNFLAPRFQYPVAEICVSLGCHMVSASYLDPKVRALDTAARERGVTLIAEMGLDPGLDHMSAMRLIHQIQRDGGRVAEFYSYGSGVLAPEDNDNPLGYAVTWNPRNVTMAGAAGAQYLERGVDRIVAYPEVFRRTWPVDVPGVGAMTAYPNRNSIRYRAAYGLASVDTLVRGTLRYPGYAATWYQIARLGLPNEQMQIEGLANRTYAELVDMFLPAGAGPLAKRVADHLGLAVDAEPIATMAWLGLFDDRRIGALGNPHDMAAGALTLLMSDRLRLRDDQKDVVILQHVIDAEWPGLGRRRRYRSTLVHRGDPGGVTAMSRTVGLPAAVGTAMLMADGFPRAGALIPIDPEVYEPMLDALEGYGLRFEETAKDLEAPHL